MAEHLILCLEAPLQAWGDVAMDPRRPTRAFPSRSGLAGLIASALGWRYRDADRTTALQDALRYAVREDRRPQVVRDYQTADLAAIGDAGWTRWGVERRGGSAAEGTQILEKYYLADGSFRVALALTHNAPVSLKEIGQALRRPARPLFLGRKSCPPTMPLLPRREDSLLSAATPLDALLKVPLDGAYLGAPFPAGAEHVRVWYDHADGETAYIPSDTDTQELWDHRDFRTNRFGGSRRIVQAVIPLSHFPQEVSG